MEECFEKQLTSLFIVDCDVINDAMTLPAHGTRIPLDLLCLSE